MWLGVAAHARGQMTSITLYIGDGVTDHGELVSSEIELWS